MRKCIQALIFRIIWIIWLPLGTIGLVFFIVRLVAYSRRSGRSATVLASLYSRWMQHSLGTRLDEPAARLTMALPQHAPPAWATLVAHRLTGYVPKVYRYPYEGVPSMSHHAAARTTFYDVALERHLAGIGQLVILGAGFDTRSYRVPARVRCFEIDTPKPRRSSARC